ncbi:MAG: alpha-L-glutamate ligase [Sphingomonadaceae bacterium]|nr:alpha-L-glutamate ligase [Sphingomonadaceae bacterium]
MPDLAVLYEHPAWFAPLFAALDRRGVNYAALHLDGHAFDPEAGPPAPVVLSRVAMSSFLRAADHPIFYAEALLAHWEARGARVLNGAATIAVDSSKARQLSLSAGLGLGVPRTRVVHRPADLPAAAEAIGFPVMVKANIGGSGAGIARYASAAELAASIADGSVPDSIDRVLLVQEYVPARGGIVTRLETLAGKFLYAIDIASPADAFDLCPADACVVPGSGVTMTRRDPPPAWIRAAERLAAAAHLDLGGIEVMVDDRDGVARIYDINALSNFVAKPLEVLGWDPHERLVDHLEQTIREVKG